MKITYRTFGFYDMKIDTACIQIYKSVFPNINLYKNTWLLEGTLEYAKVPLFHHVSIKCT